MDIYVIHSTLQKDIDVFVLDVMNIAIHETTFKIPDKILSKYHKKIELKKLQVVVAGHTQKLVWKEASIEAEKGSMVAVIHLNQTLAEM